MSVDFLEKTRSWLAPLNMKILNHLYVSEAEQGTLSLDKVKAYAANQYYIISRDAKSLALMVSRSTSSEEFTFFNTVFKGDEQAIPLLIAMAETMGLDAVDLEEYTPLPEAVVYTHYLTALAHFASPGEQAVALIVNLPVWGSNCKRLSKAFRASYQIEETTFLDLFAQPTGELEQHALSIIDHYLHQETQLQRVARLIQAYELMFWNGIYHN
ncbi:MAG: TenA family transcriptional regulator [Candidatus Bathyarchaeota archaeon]|nr:TenA family transcriptional regulator [Candidatus Bathyarchaeota archaeon]